MQLKTRSMGIEITLFIVPKKGPHKILKYPDSPVPVYQCTPYAHLIFLNTLGLKIHSLFSNHHTLAFFSHSDVRKNKFLFLQDSNWNILRNLIDENHFLRKYKERTRQWRQVAGHKDSFVEGQNQVKPNWRIWFRNIIFHFQSTILKKYDIQEEESYKELMNDLLHRVVPAFYRTVDVEGESEYW